MDWEQSSPCCKARDDAWLIDCTDLPESEATASLSASERLKWGRMVPGLPRRTYAAGRHVLRSILADALRCRPGDVPIVIGADGKPRLDGGAPLSFNLSHAWPMILIAVSTDAEVGADVELSTRHCAVDLVGPHVLGPDELAAIRRAGDRDAAFLAFWTVKEAVAKTSGLGLGLDLRSVALDPLPRPGTRTALVAMVEGLGRWSVTAWQHGSAIGAVATCGLRADLRLHHALPARSRTGRIAALAQAA